MEFLAEYGVFLAKAVTVVVAVVLAVAGIVAVSSKGKLGSDGAIEVTKVNKRITEMKEALEDHILDKELLKEKEKSAKKEEKKKKKSKSSESDSTAKKRMYVVDFDGDIKASENESLRNTITAVLSVADPKNDEVVIRLESGGGMVHSYGLASAQLNRIKNADIPLTVCVDKVAASGGYMMACVADKIIASPFAVLGSIGVVAQLPNFNKLLKKNSIDIELLTAGEHKRTLTMFGENTDQGREKFKHDLEDTHELFKSFVRDHRPVVNISEVANGDVWFGKRALDVNLVDELKTSDEYITQACESVDVFEVKYKEKKSLQEKLGLSVAAGVEKSISRLITTMQNSRFLS
ncbi:protease SohB [Alkalimarinus sediminis]|uniref:Protease SohB n=1 Tax=Alkalimarinus sediminis TaxID=1632866 RepID=A0A9E8HKG8_9ALTE|nr:protease SohB [Alkalimarinus sediminis]UZW76089.1 protease SohB [Alkalimarinus sediminis]